MAIRAGEVIHDDSHVTMYRLFKFDNPQGTVVQYQEWLENLGKIQGTVKECPWCKSQPALRVMAGEEKLAFSVKCEGEFCPVNPELNEAYKDPEEAVAEWGNL